MVLSGTASHLIMSDGEKLHMLRVGARILIRSTKAVEMLRV